MAKRSDRQGRAVKGSRKPPTIIKSNIKSNTPCVGRLSFQPSSFPCLERMAEEMFEELTEAQQATVVLAVDETNSTLKIREILAASAAANDRVFVMMCKELKEVTMLQV